MSTTREDTKEQLELKASCARLVVRLGEETPVDVTLTNRGHSALVVNSRLGMGYPESTERELYCEIRSQDQEAYLNYRALTTTAKHCRRSSSRHFSQGNRCEKHSTYSFGIV